MPNSNQKGKAGERELAKVLRQLGVKARRGQQFKGGDDSPDVVTNIEGVHLECKRNEALRLWDAIDQADTEAAPCEIPIVCHRRNNSDWVGILWLDDLVQLLYEAGRVGVEDQGPERGTILVTPVAREGAI